MSANQKNQTLKSLVNWATVIFLVYCMLVAVGTVSSGFKLFSGGASGAEQIFQFATNPFVALILGHFLGPILRPHRCRLQFKIRCVRFYSTFINLRCSNCSFLL